jgi:hypothetical protein
VTRAAAAVGLAAGLAAFAAYTQVAAIGQNIAPAYEGWYQNADGSYDLVFGYFNRNWDEEIDVPIGPNNTIEPGGPDRGQPSHFYPRRSRFVFHIRVPKDFGNRELVWTLTSNGRTERAYATLKRDYVLDTGVFEANTAGAGFGALSRENDPPQLKVEGERVRHVKVGEPVALTAVASDDGIPKEVSYQVLPGSGAGITTVGRRGLRFSWLVYRGAATSVAFDPPQFSAWEDVREGRNSPYSAGWQTPAVPAQGTWLVHATFSSPGTYVLRALAHDGALSTPADVTFVVRP